MSRSKIHTKRLDEGYKKTEKPRNRPSKELVTLIGSKVYWEHSYCCGHHSNDPHMKLKIRGIRRSKLKEQTKQLIENAENN